MARCTRGATRQAKPSASDRCPQLPVVIRTQSSLRRVVTGNSVLLGPFTVNSDADYIFQKDSPDEKGTTAQGRRMSRLPEQTRPSVAPSIPIRSRRIYTRIISGWVDPHAVSSCGRRRSKSAFAQTATRRRSNERHKTWLEWARSLAYRSAADITDTGPGGSYCYALRTRQVGVLGR